MLFNMTVSKLVGLTPNVTLMLPDLAHYIDRALLFGEHQVGFEDADDYARVASCSAFRS